MRNPITPSIILALAVLAVLGSAFVAAGGPAVAIAPGLTPQLSTSQALAIASSGTGSLGARGGSLVATSVHVVAMADIRQFESGATVDEGAASRIIWIVRGTGTFVGYRVPPGAPPVVGTQGYVVIDDATGEVLQMGMP